MMLGTELLRAAVECRECRGKGLTWGSSNGAPKKEEDQTQLAQHLYIETEGEESEGSEVSPDGDGEGWSLCIILGKDRSMERHGGVQACPGWDGDD